MTPGQDGFSTAETLEHEPPRRRFPRSLLLVGTTALVVVTGAGVAAAAVLSPSPAPTPTATDTATPSASPSGTPSETTPGHGRGWGRKMGFGGPALHGEFVVPDGQGTYATIATQNGEVTAVDQDSITVKSEDGYSRTYTLTEDTLVNAARDGIDDVKTGNTVSVFAVVADGKATATSVNDGTVRKAAGDRWGFHRGPR